MKLDGSEQPSGFEMFGMIMAVVLVLVFAAKACDAIDPQPPGYYEGCDPDPTRPGACY